MIIFDASTLILIARIELLELFLGAISMRTAIPAEVHRECCGPKKRLDSLMIQRSVDDLQIQVVGVKDWKLAAKLQNDFSLGNGEAEAIALALQVKALLVGMDDKNGINACKLLGLPFTTAAGILILCRERNLIGQSEAVTRLDLLANFGRYKNSIVEDIRTRLEACS